MSNRVCPFCSEPTVRTGVGDYVTFRCGTSGPLKDDTYATSRTCDTTSYNRLLAEKDDEIAKLQVDAARYDYIFRRLSYSTIKTDTGDYWGIRCPNCLVGPTFGEAIDSTIAKEQADS